MRFNRRLKPTVVVDLVPMIDVVFQLVIFFMVSSTFIMTPGIALDLPTSTSSEPVVMDRLVVTVVSPEEVYVNRSRTDLEGLGGVLDELTPTEEEAAAVRSVVLEGSRDVSYEVLVSVLDNLRSRGYRAVNLRTLPSE
ncbi:MAG: ExbD/TolR family protein [Spirochaetaceae bacterium]